MKNEWNKVNKLFEELIDMQQKRLLACGRQVVPHLTSDDILQPNDFLELEHNPIFRFEEGVLIGIKTAQTALLAMQKEDMKHSPLSQ